MTFIHKDGIQRRAKYVLIIIVLLNVLYPITSDGSVVSLIAFEVLYAGLFAVAIFITSDNRRQVMWFISIAVVWLVMAVFFAIDPTNYWNNQISSVILVVFHVTILWVMLRYIFTSPSVTADVLYASAAVYFLLSYMFVPIYEMVEIYHPGSFVDTTLNAPMHWQQFVYFSLITLSTSGYGDVLPVTPWARMLSGIEAAIGVLYVAILVARLVGLYQSQQRERGDSSRE
ncbi:MAG: ion channel [Anaerolineales bacterium]